MCCTAVLWYCTDAADAPVALSDILAFLLMRSLLFVFGLGCFFASMHRMPVSGQCRAYLRPRQCSFVDVPGSIDPPHRCAIRRSMPVWRSARSLV